MAVKRKRRKQMSEEQRQQAAERLAVAREKRMKNNPPAYKTVHPNVVALDENHPLSLKNVRKWIRTQRDMLQAVRKSVRQDVKGAIAREASIEGYIKHCEDYLRNGVWCDLFYGEYQERKIPGGVFEAPVAKTK